MEKKYLEHVDPVDVCVFVIPESVEVISKDSDLYRYKKQWECSELNNPVGFCLKS